MYKAVSKLPVCHVCSADALVEADGFADLRQVTSDCRPWPEPGRMTQCQRCATVQKPVDDTFRKRCQRVYSGYDVYYQSDGSEQRVYQFQGNNLGSSKPRSSQLLEKVIRLSQLPTKGRFLDFGCGNGAMLRSWSELLSDWTLYGVDQNNRYEKVIQSIPGVKDFYSQGVESLTGTYDVVTMLHSLEHIENPIKFLRQMKTFLSPIGQVLVQVPDFKANPFDLLIADHCTHFQPDTLKAVVEAAGFTVVGAWHGLVPKEITMMAQPSKETAETVSAIDVLRNELTAAVEWLGEIRMQATHAAENDGFGIFGTSIAANWLFGLLGDRIHFFLDEDPARQGKDIGGKPILAPDDIQIWAKVYIALPPIIAKSIANRLIHNSIDFVVPPALPKLLAP